MTSTISSLSKKSPNDLKSAVTQPVLLSKNYLTTESIHSLSISRQNLNEQTPVVSDASISNFQQAGGCQQSYTPVCTCKTHVQNEYTMLANSQNNASNQCSMCQVTKANSSSSDHQKIKNNLSFVAATSSIEQKPFDGVQVRFFSGDGPAEMRPTDNSNASACTKSASASGASQRDNDASTTSACNSAPSKTTIVDVAKNSSSLKWSARWADFQKPCQIGEGAYGKVFKAFYRHPEAKRTHVYAVKVFNRAHIEKLDKQNEVLNERSVLTQLQQHDCFVKFYNGFVDRQSIYMVLDFAINGDFSNFLTQNRMKLDVIAKQYYTASLVNMLQILRSKNIVHRDLKPANLLVNEQFKLVLADFGTAYTIKTPELGALTLKKCNSNNAIKTQDITNQDSDDEDESHLVGTEEYIAPEIIENRQVTFALDLWSLGIIIYQMFTDTTPFHGVDTFRCTIQDRICACEYTIPQKVPELARDLISKLLVKDPSKRLGARDIQDLKNHEFFVGLDFETFLQKPAPLKKTLTLLPESKKQLVRFLPNRQNQSVVPQNNNEETKSKSPDSRKQRPMEGLALNVTRTCASDNVTPRKISHDSDLTREMSSSVSSESGDSSCISQNTMQKTSDDINQKKVLLTTSVKKKSRLIFRPEREIFLYSDGSFAYYDQSKKLKGFFQKEDMYKVVLKESKKMIISTQKKQYVFYFSQKQEAQQWVYSINKLSSKTVF